MNLSHNLLLLSILLVLLAKQHDQLQATQVIEIEKIVTLDVLKQVEGQIKLGLCEEQQIYTGALTLILFVA